MRCWIKKSCLLAALVPLLLLLGACRQLDVIGRGAVESFGRLTEALPAAAYDDENGGWLLSPDGDTSFFFSSDFSSGSPYDVAIEFDPQPFIAAGLDISLLPSEMLYGGKLRAGNSYGDEQRGYSGEITPLASFEQIWLLHPDKLAYHEAADHYMVHFGNGNMIEFAKDLANNNKDLVFMLNPEPFIAAGVVAQQVEGWTFATIETMNASGKTVTVDRFLKIFDLQ